MEGAPKECSTADFCRQNIVYKGIRLKGCAVFAVTDTGVDTELNRKCGTFRGCSSYVWQPRPAPMLRTICKDYKLNCVIDLPLGDGASVMAALNLDKPIPVVGFVYGDHHAKLTNSLVNQELLRNMMIPDSAFHIS